MKVLTLTLLSGAFLLTGCRPDAAVRRGAVVDQPAQKSSQPNAGTASGQQPSQKKVQ